MPPLIFISAKSADYEPAEQIYRFLRSKGLSVFFSRESLPELASSDYRKQIDEALDAAQHMIVVTSSRENALSPWVEAEWGLFINEKRSGRKAGNIMTVVVGNLRASELPPSLRYYEVIPFQPSAFETLARYVRSGRIEQPDPASNSDTENGSSSGSKEAEGETSTERGGDSDVLSGGTPSVKLTAPRGGETWPVGTHQRIIWNASPASGARLERASIELCEGSSSILKITAPGSDLPANSAQYLWSIPSTLKPGDNYRIRVTVTDDVGRTGYAISPVEFSVIAAVSKASVPPLVRRAIYGVFTGGVVGGIGGLLAGMYEVQRYGSKAPTAGIAVVAALAGALIGAAVVVSVWARIAAGIVIVIAGSIGAITEGPSAALGLALTFGTISALVATAVDVIMKSMKRKPAVPRRF